LYLVKCTTRIPFFSQDLRLELKSVKMVAIQDLITLGETMGLKAAELHAFVKEHATKHCSERNERKKEQRKKRNKRG